METTRIDTYDLAALPWSRAVTQLEAASRKGDVHQSFWLATVDADGAPPWNLYRVEADVAFGVATADPQGATRWRFDGRS